MTHKDADASRPSRRELIDEHVIHEFDAELAVRNLRGPYGRAMRRRYRQLLRGVIEGRRILDVGCGFGQFSHVARQEGRDVASLDIDEESIRIAEQVFDLPVRRESVYETSLPDGDRESAVFFDSIQHLELPRVVAELKRLGVRQAVIYDSNEENPLLQRHRAASGHEEAHARTPQEIAKAFGEGGFEVTKLQYRNTFLLPATGGFQRKPLPIIGLLPACVVTALDTLTTGLLRCLRLHRRYAFRWIMVLERQD
ncbi:MAG: class I SAM-dependent methyltransferase [Phycisphaerae bacterium]